MPHEHEPHMADEMTPRGIAIPKPVTLSLEFVLQLAILLVTLTLAYSSLNARLAVLEAAQQQSKSTATETKQELRGEIDKVNVKLDLLLAARTREAPAGSQP